MKCYTPTNKTNIKKIANGKQSNVKAYTLEVVVENCRPTLEKYQVKETIYPATPLSGGLYKRSENVGLYRAQDNVRISFNHRSWKPATAQASINKKTDKQTNLFTNAVLFGNKKGETTDDTKPWVNP